MNVEHLSIYEASNNSTLGKHVTGAKEEEKGLHKLFRKSTINIERRICLNI